MDKTGQKREACRSREKFKAVAVNRGRKTEQNAKRMAKNANAIKSYSSFKRIKKRRGPKLQILQIVIMVHQQHATDVHPDELHPPNMRYDLMDANKNIDLEHVQCPPESKILMNIIKNHPLRFM
uniref:Uncharacterized protein n=1 Tax=Tanacetum cinerariifolium TaxID=118510 RepID=A0A699IT61_TANCI|nr:hypothetical protein [Tanacetum cinerariifolium]